MNLVAIRAAVTVASVYGYFLLFAQFSFVELIRTAGMGIREERTLLGAMAVAGISSGFLIAWSGVKPVVIRLALGVALLAAVSATFATSLPTLLFLSLATGAALGAATVSLAALLPGWCGIGTVAAGTGISYAICNLPWVFPQAPVHQAWIAALIAGLGCVAAPSVRDQSQRVSQSPIPFSSVLMIFTALVWMDSAAFFIIQHTEDLKSATWADGRLWRNASIHFAFALLSGVWLSGRSGRVVPAVSWIVLALAAIAVNTPATRHIAGWLYPAAVSLYSVALVVWPGWFCGASDSRSAAWRAAWLFAIAGWFGSANGIGMAETLKRVPISFIVASAVVVLAAVSRRNVRRLTPALVAGGIAAGGWILAKPQEKSYHSAAERGRLVYLSEGCIHCHSQYIRPGSLDEEVWGPAETAENTLKQEPVLIGNRRQGPDLTHIGARRSDAWLKAKLVHPRWLSPGSAMPSYAYLFDDSRGDDLVRYLRECGLQAIPDLMKIQSTWKPGIPSGKIDSVRLFSRLCATCHGQDGTGNGPLAPELPMRPTNLRKGPFPRTPDHDPTQIARIIKFGVIGSHMPGHETLTDEETASLADLVRSWRVTE